MNSPLIINMRGKLVKTKTVLAIDPGYQNVGGFIIVVVDT